MSTDGVRAAREQAEIPDDLVIRLWHRGLPSMLPAEFTLIPAGQLTETAPTVAGFYDGNAGYAEWPDPPFILFDFSWMSMARRSMEDTGAMAARIAALLASSDADWPGAEAHARLLPVTDMRLMYRVTPSRVADGDDGSARTRALLALLAQMGWLDGAAGLAAAAMVLDADPP